VFRVNIFIAEQNPIKFHELSLVNTFVMFNPTVWISHIEGHSEHRFARTGGVIFWVWEVMGLNDVRTERKQRSSRP
jgi:hypothetical protein